MDAPVPYRIVIRSAKFSVLTACGSDLVPRTYSTDGATINAFSDALPEVVAPPIAAIAALPADETGAPPALDLLGGTGAVVWHEDHADLLWPTAGKSGHMAYMLVAGEETDPLVKQTRGETDPLAIYGELPSLVAVRCPAGKEVWRVPLHTDHAVLDAQLYALGSKFGLLSLQYGYEEHEFLAFDLQTGVVRSVLQLTGSPAYTSVYPGPSPELSGVKLTGDTLTLTVADKQQGWRKWQFNLGSGTFKRDSPGQPLPALAERNGHPQGGSGKPAPPLFTQRLLPEQYGNSWIVPALMNAQGQVLVCTADTAQWVTP